MKYRIALCDDSPDDLKYIGSQVGEWAAERGYELKLDKYTSGEALLFEYAECEGYDMALLDIEMGKTDGVTPAKLLRRDNEVMQIIFVTGYSDYIAEGYEVSALHYLMKPVGREKLFSVLDRAVERLKKSERMLVFEQSGEIFRIPLDRISHAEARLNYVTIHAQSEFTVRLTLAELMNRLDERFLRIGRSTVVKLDRISRVTKTELTLCDGTVLPLPRGAYETVNRAIIGMEN